MDASAPKSQPSVDFNSHDESVGLSTQWQRLPRHCTPRLVAWTNKRITETPKGVPVSD